MATTKRTPVHPVKIAMLILLMFVMIGIGANAIGKHPECDQITGKPTMAELLIIYGSINLCLMVGLYALNRYFRHKMSSDLHDKLLYFAYGLWAFFMVSWFTVVYTKMPDYDDYDKCFDSETYIFAFVFVVLSFPSLTIIPALIH